MEKLSITLPYESISGTSKETRYEIRPQCNGVDYYPIEELAEMVGLSTRQLERYLRDINEKEIYRYVLTINRTRYITPGILILKRKYRRKVDNQEYAKWLSTHSWNHALCIGSESMSKAQARQQMESYWRKLQGVYPNNRMLLFFTTEKYVVGNSYHLHAILSIDTKQRSAKPVDIAKKHFGMSMGSDVWERDFDNKKCYAEYIVKYMHKDNDGHDFFYQNL